MVKYFGREIFPADLTFSKKEVLLKKFYLLVKGRNNTIVICLKTFYLANETPDDGSAMWSYSGTPAIIATHFILAHTKVQSVIFLFKEPFN